MGPGLTRAPAPGGTPNMARSRGDSDGAGLASRPLEPSASPRAESAAPSAPVSGWSSGSRDARGGSSTRTEDGGPVSASMSGSVAARPTTDLRGASGESVRCAVLPLSPSTVLAFRSIPSSEASWLEAQRCLARHHLRVQDDVALRTLLEQALQQPQAAHDPWFLAERGALELRAGGDALPWANEAERYQHRIGGEAGRQLALKIAELQARAYRRRFDSGVGAGERGRELAFLEREADCWRRARALVAGSAVLEQRIQERLKEVEALKAGLSTAGGGR